MKELLNLRGIISTVNTPFTLNNVVDINSLKRCIKYAVDSGVAGFLVPAMASEIGFLTVNERRLMAEAVLEVAKGRAVVIGGASSQNPDERKALARELIEMGCDGINVFVKYEDDRQYRSAIEEIASLNPSFLIIQDIDGSGYGLRDDLILTLFNEIDVFRCIKIEVSGAGVKYSKIIKITEGRLHVSGGWGVDQMIEGLDRGIHAFMPTGLYPIYVNIFRLYQEGSREEAKRLFYKVLPVITFTRQHGNVNIRFQKRLCYRMGLFDTPLVRDNQLPFDEYHERYSDEMIDLAISLISELEKMKG